MSTNNEVKMNQMEKEEFKNVIRAYTDEEKMLVARSLPNDLLIEEIGRRLSGTSTMLMSINSILTGRGTVVSKEGKPETASQIITDLIDRASEEE